MSLPLLLAAGASQAAVVCGWSLHGIQGADRSYATVARTLNLCDAAVVEDLGDEDAALRVVAELEALGDHWQSVIRGNPDPGYARHGVTAMLWRLGTVAYAGDPFTARLGEHAILFAARFYTDGGPLVLAGAQAEPAGRAAVPLGLAYALMQRHYPQETGRLLVYSNFSRKVLSEEDPVLRSDARPLVDEGVSTRVGKSGHDDELWVQLTTGLQTLRAGVIPYPRMFGGRYPNGIPGAEAVRYVSDRLPLFVNLGAGDFNPASIAKLDQDPPRTFLPGALQSPEHTPGELGGFLVVGDVRSKLYVFPNCSGYTDPSSVAKATFRTGEEAEAFGYRRSPTCAPPTPRHS